MKNFKKELKNYNIDDDAVRILADGFPKVSSMLERQFKIKA